MMGSMEDTTEQRRAPDTAESAERARPFVRLLFFFYVLLLLYLLFFRRAGDALGAWDDYLEAGRISLVPLATVRRYLRALKNGRVVAIARVNLIGNFLLFLPMGAILPLLYPSMRRTWRFVLLQTLLLLAVESAQLILRCGSCDIDDVILNLAGALAGYLAARLHLHRKRLAVK